MPTVFTVGHSSRPLDEFLALLEEHEVGQLIDVRRLPGSNKFPRFDQPELRTSLEQHGIKYRWMEGLGGRRNVSKTVPFETNAWWENRSFHNYADYALSAPFREALEDLKLVAANLTSPVPTSATISGNVAIMCSEAVWWRCHRRIIADYLLASGVCAMHILSRTEVTPAVLSEGAVVETPHRIVYPVTLPQHKQTQGLLPRRQTVGQVVGEI